MNQLFTILFVVIGIILLVVIVQGIYNLLRNTSSPQTAREAFVISKRQHISGGGDYATRTNYYVTFEFTDGSREEFKVRSRDYGILVEGDRGTLHSQGSWFKEFNRQFDSMK